MGSIDLFKDFNEADDAQLGDFGEDDLNTIESDGENKKVNPSDTEENKQEVDPGIKPQKLKRKLVTLNVERLKGSRGIIAIDDFFENIKFRGKGYEKHDLNEVMKKLEHWSHRMFPKYHFDDSLTKIERLGRKKEIALHMTRYRLGQLTKEDENQILSDNEHDKMEEDSLAHELPIDEFEDMLNQQIALSATANRMNNTSIRTTQNDDIGLLNVPSVSSSTQIYHSNPYSQELPSTSQSVSMYKPPALTDEQKVRIEENRLRAIALRAAKLKKIEEQEAEKKKMEENGSIIHEAINIDDDFC